MKLELDDLIIGGGAFGLYAAGSSAAKGRDVLLIEASQDLFMGASSVNQARLHTGGHYPRSLLTAFESKNQYRRFRERFSDAIFDFPHVYGIAAQNSRTTSDGFRDFLFRLGVNQVPVKIDEHFNTDFVEDAWLIEEPSLDPLVFRALLEERCRKFKNCQISLNNRVLQCSLVPNGIHVKTSSGVDILAQRVISCAYSQTNSILSQFNLQNLPLSHELVEIMIGELTRNQRLEDFGYTVMDGPFFSVMPYGFTSKHTLTHVNLTPLRQAVDFPTFDCQESHPMCTSDSLQSCTGCLFGPKSSEKLMIQTLNKFLTPGHQFNIDSHKRTIKTVLKTATVDDARPTVISTYFDGKLVVVLSGKLATVLELDDLI